MPVCADINSYNASDKICYYNFIEKPAETLAPKVLEKVIYIGDSALMITNNLEKMAEHRLQFISRLPGNFRLEKELKTKP